ncbi:anti-sigma factor family protein [Falsibacillus albus]|uniref:Anti-sigma factor n=1 Tax=Falsibacillus albus TaxID=2478915 RepID=A0A3L7JQZ6_9BACI|nr:anti-sigma factor [Falsibacillus albus]RLQ93247.1 anti-sigma factor [Falsibacillus albus]
MQSCPEEIVDLMHDFLDEDISTEDEIKLKHHLQSCKECQQHFQQLKKAVALVQSTSHIKAPENFTQQVMAKLPKEKKKIGFQRWFRQHPLLTAAAMFVILISGSIFSMWNEDQDFSFTKQPDLLVQNHTVIVPKGKTINGDITVKNGDLRVEGKVNGNVTVINGKPYMASVGNVTGDIKEINEVFDWLWFNIKKSTKQLFHVDQHEESPVK